MQNLLIFSIGLVVQDVLISDLICLFRILSTQYIFKIEPFALQFQFYPLQKKHTEIILQEISIQWLEHSAAASRSNKQHFTGQYQCRKTFKSSIQQEGGTTRNTFFATALFKWLCNSCAFKRSKHPIDRETGRAWRNAPCVALHSACHCPGNTQSLSWIYVEKYTGCCFWLVYHIIRRWICIEIGIGWLHFPFNEMRTRTLTAKYESTLHTQWFLSQSGREIRDWRWGAFEHSQIELCAGRGYMFTMYVIRENLRNWNWNWALNGAILYYIFCCALLI